MGARSAPHPWLRPGVFVGCLAPLGVMLWRGSKGQLGADVVASVLNQLGYLALSLLVASLSCTPVKILTGWTWPIRLRRMLGLFAFFYAALHFLTYFVVDQNFDLQVVFADIVKRKFILVGFCALVVLILLARTSTQAAVKRMGFVRWKRLHRLAYLAGGLAAIHFIWRVKADLREPLIFFTMVVVGLLIRAVDFWRSRQHKIRPAQAA